jgi:hypothetical protein
LKKGDVLVLNLVPIRYSHRFWLETPEGIDGVPAKIWKLIVGTLNPQERFHSARPEVGYCKAGGSSLADYHIKVQIGGKAWVGLETIVPEFSPFYETRSDGTIRVVIVATEKLFAGEEALLTFGVEYKTAAFEWGRSMNDAGFGTPQNLYEAVRRWVNHNPLMTTPGYVTEMCYVEVSDGEARSLPIK